MKTKFSHQLVFMFFAFLFIASCGPCRVPMPMVYFQPNIPNGGRTVSVDRNPSNNNNFMVASETGGLFRSKDTGDDWTQVSDSTTFWFNDVKYCAQNPTIIIAVASQDSKTNNGGGVWRSTDSGSSWTQVALSLPIGDAAPISAYCIANENGVNKMWIGTSNGLAYSTNQGSSWNFIAPTYNYHYDIVYAVLAPNPNQIKILTNAGVKVSTNGGSSWTFSTIGLPDMNSGVHSQIACSPFNDQDIFWASNYNNWTNSGLFASYDNGITWTNLINSNICNQPPICKTAWDIGGNKNAFDVYYNDGECVLERATFINGTPPTISGSWVNLNTQHCDQADLCFMKDNKTPVILVGDAGIMTTPDKGADWNITGGGVHGYNALQVTEVTGQLQDNSLMSDLYFATQDNSIWASPNGGFTWPANCGAEGYDLNINRSYLPASSTELTGMACYSCNSFMSGPMLTNQAGFPDAPNCSGCPYLLKPGAYIERDSVPGFPEISAFSLSTDTGQSWEIVYSFINPAYSFPKTAGDLNTPVVFTPAGYSGTTPDGYPIIGIKKIVNVTGSGSPITSDITGFGSLGFFATSFAWYASYGVDIYDPNHLIAPDIISDSVKVSYNGGSFWQTDANLTNLVTESGKFSFRDGVFTQITNITFDPTQPGHILVGTHQAGIFSSCDNGETWEKIKGTELIPMVSSFYFKSKNVVVASSYGRGLTEILLPTCPVHTPRIRGKSQIQVPILYLDGAIMPFSQINNPDACPLCRFYLVDNGDVSEISMSKENNKVSGISTTTGKIARYSYDGRKIDTLPFGISKAERKYDVGNDSTLSGMLKNGFHVKGIYAQDNIFKGLLLSKKDISLSELPKVQVLKSYIKVELMPEQGKDGVKAIRLRGKGFDKETPFEILVDRKRIDMEDTKAVFDKNGDFEMYLNRYFAPGGHTILVEQKTANGPVKEATYFIIPLIDNKVKLI